jgi:hypothetical protein
MLSGFFILYRWNFLKEVVAAWLNDFALVIFCDGFSLFLKDKERYKLVQRDQLGLKRPKNDRIMFYLYEWKSVELI